VADWYENGLNETETDPDDDESDDFDWDDGNLHKLDDHRVTAVEAEEACLDPDRKAAQAHNVGGERRVALVGATNSDRILFVVYTVRQGRIRVISARNATKDEQRKYWRS
jgi:uncharacterized protein